MPDPMYMCPHCGEQFKPHDCPAGLIPYHDFPRPGRALCPGSHQTPRNPLTDRRPLWKDDAAYHVLVPRVLVDQILAIPADLSTDIYVLVDRVGVVQNELRGLVDGAGYDSNRPRT